jgi:hypothetical protein
MYRFFALIAASAAFVAQGSAQQYQRRATMVGGGSQNGGKCTVEVVVDGAADVEIRGDQASLRNLSGQPAQWRRFECTGPVPANAADFRFSGVDGRGRQQLIQDPRNGGAAVVRIEDPDGGSEAYTFDLTWGGGYNRGSQGYPNAGPGYPNPGPDRRYDRDRYGNAGARFTSDQAVRICQDEVRQRAMRQFGGHSIEFLETRMDDNPGRHDWVIGRVDVLHGPRQPEERLSFSCSVDFETGRVRSVDLQPGGGRYPHADEGYRGYGSQTAFSNCERAVRERLERDGNGWVRFMDTRVDDNPGRNDWVIGNVQTRRGTMGFSCSVDLRDGDVRSVDIRRR